MAKETTDRRKLTPEQMENLVRVSCEISEIKHVLKNIHPENGYKNHVVFHSGFLPVAVASHKNTDIRDVNGDPIPTIVDGQFFHVITDYFNEKKNLLVEEIEAIMDERGGEK